MKKLLLTLLIALSFTGVANAQTKITVNCPATVGGVPYTTVTNADGTSQCVPSNSASSGTSGTATPGATPVSTTGCPGGGTMNAQGSCNLGYVALEPIPGVTSGTNLTAAGSLPGIINAIFKILITASALLAVLSLTIGGIQYMTASAIGNKTAGLNRARASLWGILLIAATWLILNTVNPQLLKFDLNPCASGCSAANGSGFTPSSGLANSGGTLGTNPSVNGSGAALGSATLGTITGDQMRAANAALGLDGGVLGRGLAMDQALAYDPSNLSAVNTAAINAFTSQCQSDFASTVTLGYTSTHRVAIVPGKVVGASSESALVCINN